MRAEPLWRRDGFTVVVALNPPKGTDLTVLIRAAEPLKGRADAVLVHDAADAIMRMTPLAACSALLSAGVRPVLGMNARDRNRLAIQGDLLGASALGVREVLVESGKSPSFGDHPLTRPVQDMTTPELVAAVAALNQGRDLAGLDLVGAADLACAAAIDWTDDARQVEAEFAKMDLLARAGASAFVASPQFDLARTADLARRAAALGPAVLVGVLLLKSVGMARYLNEVPGMARVPEPLVRRLAQAPVKPRAGVEIAVDLIQALRGVAQGVVLLSPGGGADHIAEVLEGIGR